MNKKQNNYLIIDIGTGNLRVALATANGEILAIEREDVQYYKDDHYKEALYFQPDQLWGQIKKLTQRISNAHKGNNIIAITVSSQREGIVIIDKNGKSIIGLPNHDHRGRHWENLINDSELIYEKTGRLPSSLFSALKVIGLREGRPDLYKKLDYITSISDWCQFKLSGVLGYEHSQASETLLYDVKGKKWSDELVEMFGLNPSILPSLYDSEEILGKILPSIARELGLSKEVKIIVGGADTQLAIKSTVPSLNDIVIVSGTTTPVVQVIPDFITDIKKATWTNRNVDDENFILETNAGVTGLNIQRLKEIFYPNEDYAVMEEEMTGFGIEKCVASLGSLVASENTPLTSGGFIFETPISHNLKRADFILAAYWDLANSIKENFNYLAKLTNYSKNYVWGCGGGFQSRVFGQMLSNLINREIRIRPGFKDATVIGGIITCNQALGLVSTSVEASTSIHPHQPGEKEILAEKKWEDLRKSLSDNLYTKTL